MDVKALVEDLRKYGVYLNPDKINAIQSFMYDDGSELYIVYFDNYKLHIKIRSDDTVKINAYPVIYSRKEQYGGR